MGPAVEMDQATDQVSLAVPRIERASRIWAASLNLYWVLDSPRLRGENPV